jgi:hypothetical protein
VEALGEDGAGEINVKEWAKPENK